MDVSLPPRVTRRGNIDRLNAAFVAHDQSEILAATLAEARRQGVMKVAKRAGMTRGSLYSALGPRGNPTLALMLKISFALGLIFSMDAPPIDESPVETSQ